MSAGVRCTVCDRLMTKVEIQNSEGETPMMCGVCVGQGRLPPARRLCNPLVASAEEFKPSIHADNMTLRDHFAGVAMVHLMTVHHWLDDPPRVMADVARLAYIQADAMIKARE